MRLRLRKTIMRKGLRKGGFTLIELLVVIAIIGILSAVVLVSLNQARVRGRDGRRLSDLQNIAIAMEIYYDRQVPNSYPYPADCTAAGVTGNANGTSGCFNQVVNTLNGADLLPTAIVLDPLNNDTGTTTHVYGMNVQAVSGRGVAYILAANLEQNNNACANDYDGPSLTLGGADGGNACDDSSGAGGTNLCRDGSGPEQEDGVRDFDFCILQRP